MSDFEYRKQEWTRRKSYLLRSLFEDDPMLSTISEEDESRVQYSPKTPSEHYRARHYETRYRSPSPLPDLVVEIVPRRPKIYDDETEEYYKRLERQIRRLYRRDYLNLPSSSSDITEPDRDYEFRTDKDDYCVQDDHSAREQSIEDEQSMNLTTENVTYVDEPRGLSPITEESSVESCTSTIDIGENLIERTVIIEKEMEQSTESSNKSVSRSKSSTCQRSAEITETINEEESDDEINDEPTQLAENNGARLSKESISLIFEPDAMRKQEERSSLFSISNGLRKSPEYNDPYYSRKPLHLMEESLANHDINISPGITDITAKATSTPNSSHQSYSSRLSKKKSFSDRFQPYSSCSNGSSFVSKYDRAMQTSFSEEETSNQEFWRNFIVGTPIIYMFQ